MHKQEHLGLIYFRPHVNKPQERQTGSGAHCPQTQEPPQSRHWPGLKLPV